MAGTQTLYGRAREHRALTEMVEHAAAGRTRGVFVEGEAGIGKTALVTSIADEAAARGFEVFRGRAHELDRMRPFLPLAEAFACRSDAADPERAAIGAQLEGATGGERSSERLIESFVRLAERAALAGPAALVLEDLHWADLPTLQTIGSVLTRVPYAALAVLVTSRPVVTGEHTRLLAAFSGDTGAHLRLTALDDEAVMELVRAEIGAEPGPRLAEAVEGAGGNPLFVQELVRSLVAGGLVERANGTAEVTEMVLAPDLRRSITRTLSHLPARTNEVLRIAAILGSAFSVEDLAAAMDASAVSLLADLHPALAADLLVEHDERHLGFRHDLIREAIYNDLPAPVRLACHRDIARALAARGGATLTIAQHHAIAATQGDADAIGWLVRAASEVSATSVTSAIDLLEQALDLTPLTDPERPRVVRALANELMHAGRFRDAERSAREALRALPAEPTRTELLAIVIWSLERQGRAGEAAALIPEAMDALDEVPETVRADMLHVAAEASSKAGDRAAALAFNDRELEVCRAMGSQGPLVQALLVRSSLLAASEPTPASLADAREAIEVAREQIRDGGYATAADLANALFRLGVQLERLDRLLDAEPHLSESRAIYEELGDAGVLPRVIRAIGQTFLRTGDWDAAVAELETVIALDDGEPAIPSSAHAMLALIAIHRDRPGDAARSIEAAKDLGARFGAHWIEGLLLGTTDPPAGAAHLRAMVDAGSLPAGTLREMGIDGARLALATQERVVAEAIAALEQRRAELTGSDAARGLAALHRGLLGEHDAFPEAIACFEVAGFGWMRGIARHEEANAAARAGDIEAATRGWERAREVYERAGAVRDLAALQADMRAAGVARGVRGPRARAEAGWDALTKTERTVVALAVEGLTNPGIGERLFISPRTVQTHLSNVFRKLGISSRVELAGAYAARTS